MSRYTRQRAAADTTAALGLLHADFAFAWPENRDCRT
jgi:hypothetical protein